MPEPTPAFVPGETIIFRVHPALILLVLELVGLALIAAVLVFLFSLVGSLGDLPTMAGIPINQFLTILALLVVGFVALILIIDYFTITYTATDRRLQHDLGIFRRTSYSMPLDKVSDLNTKQNFFGLIFNFGDVIARSDSSFFEPIVFKGIADPKKRRDDIETVLPENE